MSNLVPINEVSILPETMPRLQKRYPLRVISMELDFLRSFCEWMLQNATDSEYILELACLYEIGRRFRQRFLEPADCTLNLYAFEAIALKRILWIPQLPNPALDNCRNTLVGKLDQMMIGIY